jgi:hypothetical protein
MYKRHRRDQESNLKLQVKTLVAALQEQGLSTELRTQIEPHADLAVVGSPPDVPSSQGSNATSTAVDRI